MTEPYWAAARRGELVLQRCVECRRFTHPPLDICRHCGSGDRQFERVRGSGRIETFSVVHRTAAPGFADRVPYVIAWVALDGVPDVRVFGNVLGPRTPQAYIGMPVEVSFEQLDGFGPIPNFRVVEEDR
ncbi:Zn-ribbon domain-containing OB-fold protein [Nocardia jiangxiensis]|uniref:Zn-ribbon domain-containing OB-fold protein n=1 Tax=Nocardia jiangxiensis TaxID=282685 RepID=A0ABW6S206_9NOCA